MRVNIILCFLAIALMSFGTTIGGCAMVDKAKDKISSTLGKI